MLNKVMIIGNMTRDPELRYTPNGQSVASFGVATNRRWNDASGQRQEEAEFHEIVAWGKLGEICNQILKKGRKVYIEGRLKTRSWEAQDGTKRQRTEIIASDMRALDSKAQVEADNNASVEVPGSEVVEADKPAEKKEEKSAQADNAEEISLDDIPF